MRPRIFSTRFTSFRFLLALGICSTFWVTMSQAQIAGSEIPGDPVYRAQGMTDQPFTVEVLGVRRTVSNSLLVRVALTNDGATPLTVTYDFAGSTNPAEVGKISAIYIVDPSGQKKYGVLDDAQGHSLCSQIAAPLAPHERRELFAQMSSPPDTISAVNVFFPRATGVLAVPIGLPGAGEPLPPNATSGTPAPTQRRLGP